MKSTLSPRGPAVVADVYEYYITFVMFSFLFIFRTHKKKHREFSTQNKKRFDIYFSLLCVSSQILIKTRSLSFRHKSAFFVVGRARASLSSSSSSSSSSVLALLQRGEI